MIDKKDLMVDNLVYERNNKVFRIDFFERDKVCMNLINQVVDFPMHPMTEYFEELNPIPITEEILLKCKNVLCTFENEAGKVFGYFEGNLLIHSSRIIIKSDKKTWYNGRELNGLHEYQNIIKSLTGNNLEISKL